MNNSRFKRNKNGILFLIKNGREYRLYRYTPRNNEFEKGLKYSLHRRYYDDNYGEYRDIGTGFIFKSIKAAENTLKEYRWLL